MATAKLAWPEEKAAQATGADPSRDAADPAAAPAVSLTMIMPVHNEEENLEPAVRRTLEAVEPLVDELDLLVINDGSDDRTGEIAERLAEEDSRVRVLHNGENVNYGLTLRRGIAEARCEWLLHNGADLPLAPEDLTEFLPHFPHADVLVARRFDRSAHSSWRKLTSWTHNRLVRLLFRPRTTDLNFVQFYRREAVQALPLRSTSPAFTTPELILRAERTGLRVREVHVEFQRRQAGKAHFGRIHDILWTLRDMFSLRLSTLIRGWRR